MRRLVTKFAAALAVWGSVTTVALPTAAAAQSVDRPVVVELYTSQGCSSCPPADAFLGELAKRDDVIPLALHVDYWDYIGWKDKFASPQHTERQKAYASAAGRRSIYTPQMIVQGQEHVVGNHPKNVNALIKRHGAAEVTVDLQLSITGNQLQVTASKVARAKTPVLVQLVRYMPRKLVQIRSGENAGRTITYANIVTDWQLLDEWNMRRPLDLSTKVSGEDPLVVIVQERGPGRILAAARLR